MNAFQKMSLGIRSAADIVKRARNVKELAKLAAPSGMVSPRVLNAAASGGSDAADGTAADAAALAVELRMWMHHLEAEAMNDGKVDYSSVRGSETYARLEQTAARLRDVDVATLAPDEGKAFWLNLYNVLCIHGVIACGIVNSVMEIPTFFKSVGYQVGEHFFSPDDIENGVLRKNGKHPATGRPQWRADDPRLRYATFEMDPRIHAALVCTACSCPPVAAYSSADLDRELEMAMRGYVGAEVWVDNDKQRISATITFHYYRADFGGEAGVKDTVLAYADGEHRDALEAAFEQSLPMFFRSYDWQLNVV